MATFGVSLLDHLPRGVKTLIGVNFVVFLLQMIVPGRWVEYLALTPSLMLHKLWLWQIVTYCFLHGNFWHIFFNMFGLWMFGSNVENAWGTRAFIKFYFLCAVGAALCQTAIAPDVTVLGASGAIYGVLLAFGLIYPDAVIYLFFIFPLRAIQAVFFIALITLASAVSSGGSSIAHIAHLGGMLTGLIYLKTPAWRSKLARWAARRRFDRPATRKEQREAKAEHGLAEEVDRILDKISQQGSNSLTPDELETMRRYAQKRG